jgi:ketol-acid reductoisomerase
VYLVVAPKEEGCTVHDLFPAQFSASTLAAIANQDKLYHNNITV